MNSLSILNDKQQEAITHLYETGELYLIGQMGSGKTVVMMAAADELLRDGVVKRVLVVSTPKVVRTVWPTEPGRWRELAHLEGCIGVITGGTKKADRAAILADADQYPIVCVNFEMLPWFFDTHKHAHGFDILIVDEVTKLKAGGVQFKKLRPHIKDFTARGVSTGTPVEEDWTGLFYPMMVVDNGAALGRNKQNYLYQYFFPTDYEQRNWALTLGGDERIMKKVKRHMVVLPDYTQDLPPLHEHIVGLTLPVDAMDYYRQFESAMLNSDAVADNAAVLSGKLQQIASGFIYTKEEVIQIHDIKIKALHDLIASDIDAAEHVVIGYQFDEEKYLLKETLGDQVIFLNPKHPEKCLATWGAGGGPRFLAIHPKSAGHGIDLTAACKLVMMSPIWSRDQTRQLIARLWRRPQSQPVTVWVLCSLNTKDEVIIARERDKGIHHDMLMKHF